MNTQDSEAEIIEALIRACGSGLEWMERVSRANIGSAARGILTTDMGACESAILRARKHLEEAKLANVKVSDRADNAHLTAESTQ